MGEQVFGGVSFPGDGTAVLTGGTLDGTEGTAEGVAFSGVSVSKQSDQSVPTATETAVTFGSGSEDYDVGGWHDESTNNTRLTPPTSAIGAYVQLTGHIRWDEPVTEVGLRSVSLRWFDSADSLKASTGMQIPVVVDSVTLCIDTMDFGPIASGDYFEMIAFHTQGASLDVKSVGSQTSFTAKVLGS